MFVGVGSVLVCVYVCVRACVFLFVCLFVCLLVCFGVIVVCWAGGEGVRG